MKPVSNEQYEAIESVIATLRNENYASPEANELESWLNDMVLSDYLGEVVDAAVADENLWLDE